VLEAWRDLPVDHWESLPLTELAARLPSCSALLGHDSGIGHLAAACGVPCHLFFGPSDPATWAPRNAGVTVHRVSSGNLQDLGFDEGWALLREFVKAQTF
jgi:ADP-heptose:LPS heptosyltransferase